MDSIVQYYECQESTENKVQKSACKVLQNPHKESNLN